MVRNSYSVRTSQLPPRSGSLAAVRRWLVVLRQSCFCITLLSSLAQQHSHLVNPPAETCPTPLRCSPLRWAPHVTSTPTIHHQLATPCNLPEPEHHQNFAMESFSLFCHFPGELQLAIWEFAAIQPDIPEPEVCLAWPLNIEYDSRPPEDPVLPFTVDTAWPGVAHACRASREAFLASSRAVRYSPAAGFAVPYRRFIPAIDTLYLGQAQISAVLRFLSRPEKSAYRPRLASSCR